MSIVLNCILTGLIIITIIEGVLVIVSAIDLMSWMDAVIDALDALPSFPQINSDTISRQDTIEAMEGVDWYHIDKDGQLVHGANSKKDKPLYKVEDVYKVLEQMPSAQSEEDCKSCKHGGLKDSRCDNCRVGCMSYPSYYERKTYG